MTAKSFGKIMQGLQEARAYAQGKEAAGTRVHTVKPSAIANLRLREGLTQAQFAELLGTSLGTIRKWERGERSPSGAAARLVQLLEVNPKIVTRTLGIQPRKAARQPKSGLIAAE